MSRITTRSKIAVGVGMLLCMTAWLLRPEPPPITASFVRYNDPADRARLGDVTIEASNCTSTAVLSLNDGSPTTFPQFGPYERITFGYEFEDPMTPPKHIQISGYRLSALTRLEFFLFEKGGFRFISLHPDFTVSVDLPPRAP